MAFFLSFIQIETAFAWHDATARMILLHHFLLGFFFFVSSWRDRPLSENDICPSLLFFLSLSYAESVRLIAGLTHNRHEFVRIEKITYGRAHTRAQKWSDGGAALSTFFFAVFYLPSHVFIIITWIYKKKVNKKFFLKSSQVFLFNGSFVIIDRTK